MELTTISHFLTPREGIALDLIFDRLGESRFNRLQTAFATKYKYILVALRTPKLTAVHADVNQKLRKMADAGYSPFEICTFKRGDRHYRYERFPTSLSLETIRKAWKKSGMRDIQQFYRTLRRKYRPRP